MTPIERRIAEVMKSEVPANGIIDKDVACQIVQHCRIKGLTIDDVIGAESPKAIADRWIHRCMSHNEQTDTPTVQDAQNGRRYPLLPFSKIVHDALNDCAEDQPEGTAYRSSCWTFPITLRTSRDEIDAERLTQATERVLQHHPIFSMHIDKDGTHWYDNSYRSPYIDIEVCSEADYVYLSVRLNRILGDFTSFMLLAKNIWRAYRGEALPYDGYLAYLDMYEQMTQSNEYAEHARWLRQHYDTPDYPLLPRQDSPDGLLPRATTPTPVVVQPDYSEKLNVFSRRKHISINAFYCLVAALSIMEYNGTDEAGLTWAYLGRETREHMHIFGSLHRDIPMKLTRRSATNAIGNTNEYDFHSLFAQLRQQIEQGILHSDYPFTLTSSKDSHWHSAVNVLVQPNIAEAFEGCPASFELVPTDQPTQSYCMLDIDITLEPLTLTFNYSPRHYTQQSIQRFVDLINHNALLLLSAE